MAWTRDQFTWLGVVDTDSEGDILTICVGTPAGTVQIMAELDIEGRRLFARNVHIQGEVGPNRLGVGNIYALARFILEEIDCDEATVEGAPRTTGANPHHRPRPFRFASACRDPP